MKRGPKPEGLYIARHSDLKITREMDDVIHRRVAPFLDAAGLDRRSVVHLMKEAYLQGIRDALDCAAP